MSIKKTPNKALLGTRHKVSGPQNADVERRCAPLNGASCFAIALPCGAQPRRPTMRWSVSPPKHVAGRAVLGVSRSARPVHMEMRYFGLMVFGTLTLAATAGVVVLANRMLHAGKAGGMMAIMASPILWLVLAGPCAFLALIFFFRSLRK
jgi:hypothetical protein